MRIAYVCCDPGVPVFGGKGCSVHVQEVLRQLVRMGGRVDLFATNCGGAPPADLDCIHVRQLDLPRRGRQPDRERALMAMDRRLAETFSQWARFDLIYERHALHSCGAMEFARSKAIPSVLEVNAPLIEEQLRYRQLSYRREAERGAARAMAAADVVVAVSRPVAAYVARYRGQASGVHVIPNGVDVDRFAVDRPPSAARSGDLPTLGFVGSLKPWHGVSELIAAYELLWQRGRRVQLLIVGDGPERSRLQKSAAALPSQSREKVQFTGLVHPDEIPGWMAFMDIATAPYPPMEEFYFSPLKLFEYMAAGLPIVASRVGQIVDVLDEGVIGVLYEPGDIPALANALEWLLDDPNLRSRLGRAARDVVAENFTWRAVVKRILESAGVGRKCHPADGPRASLDECPAAK